MVSNLCQYLKFLRLIFKELRPTIKRCLFLIYRPGEIKMYTSRPRLKTFFLYILWYKTNAFFNCWNSLFTFLLLWMNLCTSVLLRFTKLHMRHNKPYQEGNARRAGTTPENRDRAIKFQACGGVCLKKT